MSDTTGKTMWDETFLPLMKILTGKKGVEYREASEVDKKKVNFFRGKDLVEFLLKKDAVLKRRCQKALDASLDGACPADEEDVCKLCAFLLEKGFLAKGQYRPLIEKKDESGKEKKKKWPDRLVRISGNTFDPQGFYIIVWEGSAVFRYLMLTLVVSCIIAGCLFPVWPIWARIAAWYLGLALCTLYFCLEISRMGCFAMGWLVGVDFWILPNFNDEYAGVVDSFKPIYSFDRRKDGALLLLSRLAVVAIVYVAVEELSKTHSLSDVKDFMTSSYEDIIKWGENKALMLEGPAQRMALPSLQELEKEQLEEERKEKEEATKVGGGDEGGSSTSSRNAPEPALEEGKGGGEDEIVDDHEDSNFGKVVDEEI